MSYEKYTFSINDNGKKRTYSGERLKPKIACEFGAEVYCDICKILNSEKMPEFDGNDSGVIGFVIGILGRLDPKSVMQRFNYILSNTKVIAVEEGSQREFIIGDEGHYNEWFSRYPQDTFIVVKNIIWENASPFLPSQIMGAINSMKEAGSEVLKNIK